MSRGIILDWKGDASALVVFRQENKDRADSRTSPISEILSTAPEEVVPTVPMTKNGTYEEEKSQRQKGEKTKESTNQSCSFVFFHDCSESISSQ